MKFEDIKRMSIKEMERMIFDYYVEEMGLTENEADRQVRLMSLGDMEQFFVALSEEDDSNEQ
jgi:hypothetical protein